MMRSYPPYVGGADLAARRWSYVLRASALLDDAFGALRLKRELDRAPVDADPPVADDRLVGRVALATEQQSARALAAARRAQPEWAARPLAERIAFGDAVHEMVRTRAEDFIRVLVAEGHPRRLAEWEVAGVLAALDPATLRECAAQLDRRITADGRELRLVRRPDGVVAISPPQNAAASNSLGGVPALVAGNTLVVKAPRSGPFGVTWAWRELVAPVLESFDAPPGTLNVVCAAPAEMLNQWLDSPDVDTIFYFGDSERGLDLGRRAVERGKKTVLELSGNDGMVVWHDAEVSLAARAAAECFLGSAQICMVPRYAVVHPDVADEFVERLVAEAALVRPGPPDDPEALLTPVLRTDRFAADLADALAAGARLVAGGDRMDQDGRPSSSGLFLQPTVIRVDGLAAAVKIGAVTQETFHPIFSVVVGDPGEDASTFDAAVDFVDGNPYGLRTSLWSADPARIERFCARVTRSGVLKVNDSHVGFVSPLPTHGGPGRSGGPYGEANLPMLRTTRLQGISVGTGVTPRDSVFDSATSAPRPHRERA